MDENQPKTIITGASSGIGHCLGRALLDKGHRVTGIARRKERLDTLALKGGLFDGKKVDLTDGAERVAFVESYLEHSGCPDYLILNAGLAHYGELHRISDAQVEEQIEINLKAVVDMTRRFLPKFLELKRGRIIVISSVVGIGPVPFSATYSATKHAVIGFVRGLRLDCAGRGLSISAVCPAAVATEYASNATNEKTLRLPGEEPVERVVAGIVRKLDRDSAIIFPTFRSAIWGYLLRLAPNLMEWRFSSTIAKFTSNLPEDRVQGD